MTPFRFTLLGDGPSDRCLLPVVRYALRLQAGLTGRDLVENYASLEYGPAPAGLELRIRATLTHLPCDVLFVHRDAESAVPADRQREILEALPPEAPPAVPVVPVRMSEAWLLVDSPVIRRAADKPNGRVVLRLPPLASLESLADPKATLSELLITASEKSGRALDKFKHSGEMSQRRTRVADLLAQEGRLVALNGLPAFRTFLAATSEAVVRLQDQNGW